MNESRSSFSSFNSYSIRSSSSEQNQHGVLVEVVLVQTIHRDIGKQWSGFALHDTAIQADVR